MKTLPLLFFFTLLGCEAGDAPAENMEPIDCGYVSSEWGWDESLPDASTPRQRLEALGSPAVVTGTWAIGAAFSGTLTLGTRMELPSVETPDGEDAASCEAKVLLPITVQLGDATETWFTVDADASSALEGGDDVVVDAAIPDHPRYGIVELLEESEVLDGVDVHLDGGSAGLSGRVHALIEGANDEVAWQRDADIVMFQANERRIPNTYTAAAIPTPLNHA
jgi:hypothetical protein